MFNFKKKSPPASHERSGLKRFLSVLLFSLGGAGVLAFFWFLSQLGPQKVDYQALGKRVEISPEVLALYERSLESEAQFDEVLVMRPPTAEDLELLKRALDQQAVYVEALPGFDSEAVRRREDLDQRYQDLQGERLKTMIDTLQAEAQTLANAHTFEAARGKYQEAFALQKSINEKFPLSGSYNVARATRLQRQARYCAAEPLLQRSVALEDQADVYIAQQNWEQAEALLGQSIALQDRLNREYRGSNQASLSRFERLNVKQAGVQSGQYQLEIEQMSDQADARFAEGKVLQAASLYQEAVRLQQQLNDAYPASPYASPERVEDFQRKSQTAESSELSVVIEENHTLLNRLLSERHTEEAAEVIVALRRDIEQLQQAYPLSALNDDELQLKVRYLSVMQSDLGLIQGRVYEALLAIPDVAGVRLLRTEVPQALYSLLMASNPSRNQGERVPVDSVSWVDAKRFCKRLSWILGKAVRLPTEHEFRQALGPLRYVALEAHVWSRADPEGLAQPIGTKAAFASGVHDLLGNVSEWLESMDLDESGEARHVGGHVQDQLDVIFTVPVRTAARTARNRMIGFRVVVAD
jgi:tetratricopeptide (TPR) repeat protein